MSDKVFSVLASTAKKQDIQQTADLLGVSYSYVHQMLSKAVPISRQMRKEIKKLKPRKYPPTVTVRY